MEFLSIRLRTPDPELERLSMCASSAPALGEWVANLPIANTSDTARRVYDAVHEVARLDIPAGDRFDCLEALRTTTHYICARLDRTALGVASADDIPTNVAQRLQIELAEGYKAVIRDLVLADAPDRERLATAVHRTISDLSRTALRSCQFYAAAPDSTWQELNQLYLVAEHYELLDLGVPDDENHNVVDLKVREAYLRIALLALARPNQLPLRHLSAVFNALELWTRYARIGPRTDPALFQIDLEADRPPRYTRLCDDDREPRGIDTSVLVYELEAFLNEIESRISIPDFVSPDLVGHLVDAWGTMVKRRFRRARASGVMKVCIGLRAAHYYISGGVEFAEQLGTTDALLKREINPFLADPAHRRSERSEGDVWNEAFDLKGALIPENPNVEDPERLLLEDRSPPDDRVYPHFDTEIVDTSPGGYCLRWAQGVPTHLSIGELLAVREAEDERWCIAISRWIRQDGDQRCLGIELLSPRAVPVAVRVIQTRGSAMDYARALLLPALEVIAQPSTLITPRVPFQVAQKVNIRRQGIQTTAQLLERARGSESFTQFTFRMLDGYLENAQIDLKIESLWDMIGADQGPDSPRR